MSAGDEFAESVFRFLEDLPDFQHGADGIDRKWNLIFPDPQERWHHVLVTRYAETHFFRADGRHDGLLDIRADSPDEFEAWLDGKHPLRSTGGHPWEIKRGGNTTHIDLAVYRPHDRNGGYRVELIAPSIGRLAEAVRMLLAIHAAKLPIAIDDPEGTCARIQAQDNIGIVPGHDTLHRASAEFDKHLHVYDVLHYADLGRRKRRLAHFISWRPLPLLVPRTIP
jgi:hypothetical protein